MTTQAVPTLLTPYGYSASTCGYCSPSGSRSEGRTSKSYGMLARQMSAQFYQEMIDRGWRRSGDYVYHPDMAQTCCPQYTIRLDAEAFKPNKKQRQVMSRWNRFLQSGVKPSEAPGSANVAASGSNVPASTQYNVNAKGKGKAASDWTETLRQFEADRNPDAGHRFEITFTPAEATDETYELYKRYQMAVHKDPETKVSRSGFERFLCRSPLVNSPIRRGEASGAAADLPSQYGSYHMLYRVDSQLVGISVIDVLLYCVSSVYFIWDPDWAWASLGKLSALYETAIALELRQRGARDMKWLYMGYWIANCAKMRYKGDYSPSYLLDPGTNVFYPLTATLDKCLQARTTGHRPFEQLLLEPSASASEGRSVPDPASSRSADAAAGTPTDDDSDIDDSDLGDWPDETPPGFLDPRQIADEELDRVLVLLPNGRGLLRRRGPAIARVGELTFRNEAAMREEIRRLLAAVGRDHLAIAGNGGMRLDGKGILSLG